MSEILINEFLLLGTGLFFALLIACLPLKSIAIVTTPFSMKTFGIRKIKRWHSRTDTLANFMIWISIILCLAAPWIAYSPWIYAAWLTFTWLCTLSRAVRMTAVRSKAMKRVVIFFVNAIFAIGLITALGSINGYMLWKYLFDYANMIESKEAFEVMLYLNNITPFGFVSQMILLLVPVVNLWGQFKYMRLENTFKAASIYTYVLKGVLLLVILFGLGAYAPKALSLVYYQDQDITQLVRMPLSREEVNEITEASRPQQEEQPVDPNAEPNAQPADPNAQPADPNADPNAQPVDPNAQPVDPNAVPEDPNAIPVDPNADPNAVPAEGM